MKKNILITLRNRECCSLIKFTRIIGTYLENQAATKSNLNINYGLPSSTKSTFVICFNSDGTKMATGHGNHTIQILNCYSRKVIQVLPGHCRTPWCLSFHPVHNCMLASGCLGGEVRLWNLENVCCNNLVYQSQTVISSLTFHPVDDILIICSSNKLIFFNWNTQQVLKILQMKQPEQTIRFIRFTCNGCKLMIAISNMVNKYNFAAKIHNSTSLIESIRSESCINGTTSISGNQILKVSFTQHQEHVTSNDRALYHDYRKSEELTEITHQLQLFDCNNTSFLDLHDRHGNVIVPYCKIRNDSSVGLTNDGRYLAVFVPIADGPPRDVQVKVISLKPDNYLQCVYSRNYGSNAVSICFSSLNNYLMIGLAARNLHWQMSCNQIVAQILELPIGQEIIEEDAKKPIFNVYHTFCGQAGSYVSVNTICFHPDPGFGIFYGTNHGQIYHCRINWTKKRTHCAVSKYAFGDISSQQRTKISKINLCFANGVEDDV